MATIPYLFENDAPITIMHGRLRVCVVCKNGACEKRILKQTFIKIHNMKVACMAFHQVSIVAHDIQYSRKQPEAN